MKFLFAVAATLAYVFSYVQACSPSDTTFVNITAKIINVEPVNSQIKHSVGGSVKIMTGCTFFVRNMTIIPSGNGVYWYGIPKSNTTIEPYPRIVAMALGSYNGQSISFTLDSQYSFDDISIIELRSEGDNRAYGAFSVNGSVEEYYNLKKGADLDFDPKKPFASNSTKSVIVYTVNFLFFFGFLWSFTGPLFILFM